MSTNADPKRGAAPTHHYARVRALITDHVTVRSERIQRTEKLEESIVALVGYAESSGGEILCGALASDRGWGCNDLHN